MSTSPDNGISRNASKSLPTELLNQIFTQVATHLQKARSSRRKCLLDLRLVCKSWSDAVIPIVLRSIRIKDVEQAQYLLENWKTIFSYTHDFQPRVFPVHRLVLIDLFGDTESKSHASIDKAVELIRLFSGNLRSLTLDFASMGCPTPLVDAVKMAKSLKKLDIQSDRTAGSSDLANLLDATPDLEELTIGYSAVPPMKFSESALTKLRYLDFPYAYADANYDDSSRYADLRGIVNICEKAGSSLKIIKCTPTEESGNGLLPVLKAVQETLEGLFTLSLCHQWDYHALFVECPRLRVVESHPWDDLYQHSADTIASAGWFSWPLLQNVRTLVFPNDDALDPWLEFFESAKKEEIFQPSATSRDKGLFRKLPHLKQCLFKCGVSDSLIEDFEAYGIECWMIDDDLEPVEIMKLDAQLDTDLEDQ
ncbi:uncharacterized protein MELLADRAFT_103570 [Melampsora larici-populina 98AG31]|uniref:F-box domain-containing protein n=1 Tax=Melampsora larici-populina (strain 98AG31 / pathotype 3-4-7) TaxID=747676 RepID=F4RBS3_MELLP|nr:uncharacterized protein MELLADRAFT_103570 [Melampsora larici-populina 98AG31]EGG10287.1 hypothetical protein MELLADRAFT_103570 [Melampsora larici-populina 98AG31]